MGEHSEFAYVWPAIPFGAAIGLVIAHVFTAASWVAPVGLGLMAAAFGPCCWLRDWWVRR